MTQIGKHISATRRPGQLGIHSLDHFAFSAPDLTVAENFHLNFGLDVKTGRNSLDLKTFGNAHRWVSIVEGGNKQLQYLSFGVFDEDMPEFIRHLENLGIKRISPPRGFESNGVWIRDPDGTPVELRIAEKSSPSVKQFPDLQNFKVRNGVAPKRSEAGLTRPNRFAHLLLFTADVSAQVNWYHHVLGLRLSDRSGDHIAFMHGIHGSDHHMVAFVKSDGPGIHHTSWDVGSIHEVGFGASQMREKGFSEGWGVGRHVLGSNYFHYVRDPWGSYAEFSCDIDFIPHTLDWEAGDHEDADAFYVWGPTPPSDFSINYELTERSK